MKRFLGAFAAVLEAVSGLVLFFSGGGGDGSDNPLMDPVVHDPLTVDEHDQTGDPAFPGRFGARYGHQRVVADTWAFLAPDGILTCLDVASSDAVTVGAVYTEVAVTLDDTVCYIAEESICAKPEV